MFCMRRESVLRLVGVELADLAPVCGCISRSATSSSSSSSSLSSSLAYRSGAVDIDMRFAGTLR